MMMDDQEQSSSSTASSSSSATVASSSSSTAIESSSGQGGGGAGGGGGSFQDVAGPSTSSGSSSRAVQQSRPPPLPPINSVIQDSVLTRELFFMVYRWLEKSTCTRAAEALAEEIEAQGLLPQQYDWRTGNPLPRSLVADIKSQYRHITGDHLLKVMKHASRAISQITPPPVLGIESLIADGRFSMLRSITPKDPLKSTAHDEPLPRSNSLIANLANHRNHAPIVPSMRYYREHPGSIVSSLIAREMSGPKPITHILPTSSYSRYHQYRRVLGHLSAVYCVLFDHTGRFIVTGADDKLIKIWSAEDGRLLMTLRGHMEEITDITIDLENSMLAAGSCDKMIRVWCLKTSAPITVLSGHNAFITSIKFCPLLKNPEKRYLVSSANDGCVCFWEYNPKTRVFKDHPIRFTERKKPNAHVVCTSFSAGGVFLAIGCSDNYLRVYHVAAPVGPTKILEIEEHADCVDSIQFSHHSTRFVSGAKDGVARIWFYEKQNWKNIELKMTEKLPGTGPTAEDAEKKKLRVSMVGWTCDDAYVITSSSDNAIRVWDSTTGKLRHVIYAHEMEVFVIECHPRDPRVILTGGHDGAIMLWDVVTGEQITSFINEINGQGYGAIFDCKWSPDGMMFAATDSHGHLILFGIPKTNIYDRLPAHMFFHTDYRPVLRDLNQYVIDEQSQIAPHLMPPPFLVDIDGNPYPPALQRLVPGRENSTDQQLVPYIAAGEQQIGQREEPRVVVPEELIGSGSEDEDAGAQPPQRGFGPLYYVLPPRPLVPMPPEFGAALVPADPMLMEQPENIPIVEPRVMNQLDGPQGLPVAPPPVVAVPIADQQLQDQHDLLDQRIQQFQREIRREPNPAQVPEPFDRNRENRNGVNLRNGDVEGVRQPQNFLTRGAPNQRPTWHSKPIVPKLPESQIANLTRRQQALAVDEEEYYSQEKKKRADQQEMAAIKMASLQSKFTRSKRRNIIQRRGVRLPTRYGPADDAAMEDEDDEDDRDFSAEEFSSSSVSDESDDSDWNARPSGGAGPSRAAPAAPTGAEISRSERRKRRRPNNSSEEEPSRSEHSDEEDERSNSRRERPGTSATASTSRRRPRKRGRRINSNNDDDDESGPATPPDPEQALRRREQLNQIRNDRQRRYAQQFSQFTELPEGFRPPEWLTDTKPKRTPYFPQIGDEVVYFRSGHQMYLDNVRQKKIYSVNAQIKPYKLKGSDSDEIFASILDVKFNIKPGSGVRVATLKLMVLDPEAEEPVTGISFVIKYHDVENVVDFIILKKFYDQSIAREWKAGDEFRAIIDDKWWFGLINTQREAEPFTYFQCFEVTWVSGDTEQLSPWDLEPIPDEVQQDEEREDGLPVSDEEWAVINDNGWLSEEPEERERLSMGLIRIMEYSQSEAFNVPVDLNQHPIYGYIIAYLMDLSTIKDRLESGFYRRVEALLYDVGYIETNAEQYNEPGSEIVKRAKVVATLLKRFVEDPDCFDPTPIYQDVVAHQDDLMNLPAGPSGSSNSRASGPSNQTSPETDRPRRSTRRPVRTIVSDSDDHHHHHNQHASNSRKSSRKFARQRHHDHDESSRDAFSPTRVPSRASASSRDDIRPWKQNCRELIDYMFDLQDSEPFRSPVDPIHYPNYNHVIDTPMDMTTVKEQLLADIYDSPVDFCKDMRLIFANSKSFNTNKKSRIYSMTIRLGSLFEDKMRKIMADYKSEVRFASVDKRRRRPLNSFAADLEQERTSSRPSRKRNHRHRRHRPSKSARNRARTNAGASTSSQVASTTRSPNKGAAAAAASTSSAPSTSAGTSKRTLTFSDQDEDSKYGLRNRNKRSRKVYREEDSDDEEMAVESEEEAQHTEEDDEDTRHSTRSRGSASGAGTSRRRAKNPPRRPTRKAAPTDSEEEEEEESHEEEEHEDEEEVEEPESPEIPPLKTTRSGRVVKKPSNLESDDEEEEEESTKEESDREEPEEYEEEEEAENRDSDATQIEDEDEDTDKENSLRRGGRLRMPRRLSDDTGRRSARSAARKRVNYDENDEDEEDSRIREKSTNAGRGSGASGTSKNRSSFSVINESSRDSMTSNRSSAITHEEDDDDSNSGNLRRSRRNVRPARRYRDDSDESAAPSPRPPGGGKGTRSSRAAPRAVTSGQDDDNSSNTDLYSAIKTRHRAARASAPTGDLDSEDEDGGDNEEEAYVPTRSERAAAAAAAEQHSAGGSGSHYPTRNRGGVFQNGRTTVMSR